jgi:UDP-N-acetylmuramyl pentapeptide phosphotransferase/UDP-N-acetylglucosamine-1-phosphate transferase
MPEILIYIFLTVVLLLSEIFYFSIAKRYKIVDRPNDRSSHQSVTIRGGGIIFPIAIILSLILIKQFSFLLITALFLTGLISLLDDINNVSNYIRFVIHGLAVSLTLLYFDLFMAWPIWLIILAYILFIGIINAFNFMDGINGITGVYSLVILFFLFYINQKLGFTYKSYIIIPGIACLVFLYFNFRKKAKCFAGDVGSVTIGFWIAVLLLMLIIDTENLKYLLFLSVYGIDTVLTIIHRLILKQNIFKAHRMHLFQYMVNERKLSHLRVAAIYGIAQALINIFIIATNYNFIVTFLIIMLPLGLVYIYFKFSLNQPK